VLGERLPGFLEPSPNLELAVLAIADDSRVDGSDVHACCRRRGRARLRGVDRRLLADLGSNRLAGMAKKSKVTLTLGDGTRVVLELPEDDPQGAFERLLYRKGEYAAGWIRAPGGYYVNLSAVVKMKILPLIPPR
jgi:hypothetical protein